MNPKLIGVIAGVALALLLFRSDLAFWKHGGVEELYNKAEASYEDARKSEDYSKSKYEDAIQKYNAALEASNKGHELYDEFDVLVNYRIAHCYSDMAEREGQAGVVNYAKALDIIERIESKAEVTEHKEGIHYLRGHILCKQNKYEEAETKLREFVEAYHNSQFVEDALCALGNINNDLEKYSEARQDFEKLLKRFPNSTYASDARFLIAQSHLAENNNFQEANKEFEKLIEKSSKAKDEVKYRYAHNLLRLGINPEALREYEDLVAKYPQSNFLAAAYFDMGDIYVKETQYEQARQHFELALQDLPNVPENEEIYKGMELRAKLGIAASSFELQDWQRVVGSQDIVAQIQAEAPEFLNYFNKLLNDARYQLELYDQVQSYNTTDVLESEVWSFSKEADAHFEKEEYALAAEKYKKAWNKAPMETGLYKLKFRAKYREGLCYFKIGTYNEAVAAYNLALNFGEGSAKDFVGQKNIDSCRLNLALAYEKLNDWTNARANYNKILADEQSEHYKDAQLLLAQSYAQENMQKAIEEYEKSSGDKAHINRANLLYKIGDYTKAAALYEHIANEDPPGEHANEAQYMAGVCYYQITEKKPEDLSKAIEIFDKVIKNSGSPQVLDACYGKVLASKDLAEKYLSLSDKTNNDDEEKKKEFAKKTLSQWRETENIASEALKQFNDDADVRKISVDTIRKYAIVKRYQIEGIPQLDQAQKDVVTQNPHPTAKAKAQLKRGHFYSIDQQFGDPVTAYQDLVNISPGDEFVKIAKYQIVAQHYKLNEYEKCVRAADDAINSNPDEDMLVRIYYMRGKSYYTLGESKEKAGDKEGATADFQSASNDLMEVARRSSSTGSSRKALIADANKTLLDIPSEFVATTINVDELIEGYDYVIRTTGDNATQDILTKINAYYQIGLIYEKQPGTTDNANQAFDDLRNYYENHKNKFQQGVIDKPTIENIIDKVIDAGLRRTSLISRTDLDTAISDAQNVRNEAISSPYTTELRQIQAQYQVGYLYYQRMLQAVENRESQDGITLDGRKAIPAFQEALKIQPPPEEAIPYVRDSAFLMGEIAANLPRMSENAKTFLNNFITRANKGEFGSVGDLMPSALFSLAKVEHKLGNYDESINKLNELISKYSNSKNDKPLWQFYLGESYFGKRDYSQAKSEYQKALDLAPQSNPTDETSYDIGDNALYGMIVCVDQIKRQTAVESEQEILDEEKKRLNKKMTTDYPESDYAPQAYLNLGVVAYNKATKAPDIDTQIEHFEDALENYQRAYDHHKIKADNKKRAKNDIKDTLEHLIQKNIAGSRRKRGVTDESGAIPYNENAIAFCDQLIDIYSGDSKIAEEVSKYVQQIESEVKEIEPFLPGNLKILEIKNSIDGVKGKI